MTDPRTNQRRTPPGGSDVEQRGRDEHRRGAIDETDGGGFPPAEKPDQAAPDPAVNSDPAPRRRPRGG